MSNVSLLGTHTIELKLVHNEMVPFHILMFNHAALATHLGVQGYTSLVHIHDTVLQGLHEHRKVNLEGVVFV